jgi:hypothetical protein
MPFKARTVPGELIILRILNKRMDLTEEEKKFYLYQEKGYAPTGQVRNHCWKGN